MAKALKFNATNGSFDLVTALNADSLTLAGALSGATTGDFSTSVTTPDLIATAAGPLGITAAANNDISFKMGDAAGVQKLSFKGSDDLEKASILSDGSASFVGVDATTGALSGASVSINGTSLAKSGSDLQWGGATLGTQTWVTSEINAAVQGLDIKDSVKALADSNLTVNDVHMATGADGIALAENDRVLLTGQTTASENGIYSVGADGSGVSSTGYAALTRVADLTTGDNAAGVFTFVEEGTTHADSGWVCTADGGADVVGTNSLSFSQFSGAGQIDAGDGLAKNGNVLSVNVDNSSIEISTDTLQVAALGITNAMLAGSIANAKLVNSTISGKALGTSLDALSAGATSGITLTAYDGSAGVTDLALDINGMDELLTATLAQTDDFAFYDASAAGHKRITFSNLEDSIFNNISGDATVAPGGALSLSSGAVGTTELAADAVTSAEIAADAVDSSEIAAGAVDLAHMSINSVDSDQYVDGSIDAEHFSEGVLHSKNPNTVALTSAGALAIDVPVYLNGTADTVAQCDVTSVAAARCIGYVATAVGGAGAVDIVVAAGNKFTPASAAIEGTTFTIGNPVYISNGGLWTTTAPSTGEWANVVGVAVSTTDMVFTPGNNPTETP